MSNWVSIEGWAWVAGAAVVNVLWQGAIIGAGAAAVLRSMRGRAAQARYIAACVGLLTLAALLPINLLILEAPETHAPALPEPSFAPASPDSTTYTTLSPTRTSEAIEKPSLHAELPHQAGVAGPTTRSKEAVATERSPRPRPGHIDWYDRAMPWVGSCWWLGVLGFALYDFMGLVSLACLRARAYPATDDILRLTEDVRTRLGVHVSVQVRMLEDLSTALVTGFFRVVILLPASMATGMTLDAVEAILAHELAHIRRWDRWLNLIQRVIEALLFFHPAAWWLSRKIRIERELCCDEAAIAICADRALYVRALLSLAEHALSRRALALSSHGGDLEGRVRYILGASGDPRSQGRLASALCAAAIAVIPILLTVWSAAGNAVALPERILHFPIGRSVGTLYGRWVDDETRRQPWMPAHNEGWTMLAPARGDVKIPADTLVKLNVVDTNLTFLKTLDPDAIYFLDASFREMSDDSLAPIAHLTGLRALNLSDNAKSMDGSGLGALAALRSLEWLYLERTELSGMPPGVIAGLSHLRYLAGHFGTVTDSVLRQAASLEELEFLSLKGGEVSADALTLLNGNSTLRGLALDNVKLTSESLLGLEELPALRYLDLRKNPLSDEALRMVAAFPSLTVLNLDRTPISDAGVEYLFGNTTLEQLCLIGTSVTADCLDVLATLPSLKLVNLFKTQVDEVRAGVFSAGLASLANPGLEQQRSSNPDAPKVGLLFSHATATDHNITSQTSGYTLQDSWELARCLNEANVDLYAIVEPGTEMLGELPWLLQSQGLTAKTVDAYDAQALSRLDVIFVAMLVGARISLLDAVGDAVEGGVGLVNIGAIGISTPGELHPSVERLTGLEQAVTYWQAERDVVCPVVATHPILGRVRPGDSFVLTSLEGCSTENGLVRDATVLIDAPADYPGDYPVLYVRELGRGRIVCAQWNRPFHPGIPFPGFSLYVRALNWVAHRDVETTW